MSSKVVDQKGDAAVTLIRGARYATESHTAVRGLLQIAGETLRHVGTESTNIPRTASEIDLQGFLLLPGFINAHDHLQYALHPRLGCPPYRNYVEWGDDIHANLATVISCYNSVPKDIRLWWGGIRNLLCGVTTVCHHDPSWPELRAGGYPIEVLRSYGWAHSVRLSPDIREAWLSAGDQFPFFIHACEGTDELARSELAHLDSLGILNAKTVIVHGLALDVSGFELLQERQAALILCLSSNQFLYGDLPDMKVLNKVEKIALGSDSPLTAVGDLLDEVRFAIEQVSVPIEKAYQMITERPAVIMGLSNGEGHIRESGCADLIAIRGNADPPHKRMPTLSWRDVEFVMIRGEVKLASEEVWRRLPPILGQGMEPLSIDGHIRWLRAPVRKLVEQAEAILGTGMVRLGDRVVQLVDKGVSPTTPYHPMSPFEQRQ